MNQLNSLLKSSPFCNWLGMCAITEKTDSPIFSMPFAEHHIGNVMIRAIHGGIQASFMEYAAAAQFAHVTNAIELPRPLNTEIIYLRPTSDKDCTAIVKTLRHGKRLATLEVTSWQDDPDKPVASGRFNFLVQA